MKRYSVVFAVAAFIAATAFAAEPLKPGVFVFPSKSIGKFCVTTPGVVGYRDVGDAAGVKTTIPGTIALLKPSQNLVYKPNYWQQVPANIDGLDLTAIEFDNATMAGVIKRFKNLRYLNISDSEVDDGLFELLPELPGLEMLAGSQLELSGTGLRYLNKFPKLIQLDLHNSTVRGENLKYLVNCPQLHDLLLNETPVDDRGCSYIAKLPKISSVSLARTAITSKAAEALYPARGTLRRLDLWLCDFGDDGLQTLAKFGKLTNLTLHRSRTPDYTAKSIQALQPLKSLQHLDFSGGTIHDDVLEAIPKNVPQLNSLWLDHCKSITDKGLGKLSALSQMQDMHINEGVAGDELMKAATHWPKLHLLMVGGGSVTNAGARAFFDSKSPVEFLMIDNCKIDDTALPNLFKLQKLNTLSLNGDNITDAAVPALIKCKTLTGLGLRATKVTPDGVARIRRALPNCNVFI
jgi:Leucine-rich repeat (LRR) protein